MTTTTENAFFTRHTAETSPEGSRDRVKAAEGNFGFLPSPVAFMSESPELLDGFLTLNGIFQKSSLSEIEREVIIMTISTRVECHYCVAMHTAILTKAGTNPTVIENLREKNKLADPKLDALRVFTLAVMNGNGHVDDADMQAFLDAGYTTRSALDVVLGLGTYTLSTAANRLTGAEIDPPFQSFEWSAG